MTKLLIPLLPQAAAPADSQRPRAEGSDLSVSGPSLHSWSHAVATSSDASLVLDPLGAVVAASDCASAMLGKPVVELLGRELHRAAGFVDFHPSPRSLALDGSSLVPIQALRADSPARGLMRVRLDDGELMTCDCVAAPLHDRHGQLVGVLVLLKNVTR